MADLNKQKEPAALKDVDPNDGAPVGRYRARVRGGGYRRLTISVPTALFTRLGEYRKAHPTTTISAFASDALEAALADHAGEER